MAVEQLVSVSTIGIFPRGNRFWIGRTPKLVIWCETHVCPQGLMTGEVGWRRTRGNRDEA